MTMSDLVPLIVAATASVLAVYCVRGVVLAEQQARTTPNERREAYRTMPDWVLHGAAWFFAVAWMLAVLIGIGALLKVWAG